MVIWGSIQMNWFTNSHVTLRSDKIRSSGWCINIFQTMVLAVILGRAVWLESILKVWFFPNQFFTKIGKVSFDDVSWRNEPAMAPNQKIRQPKVAHEPGQAFEQDKSPPNPLKLTLFYKIAKIEKWFFPLDSALYYKLLINRPWRLLHVNKV